MTEIIDLPVASFPSASSQRDPLIYPGNRPAGSYLTDGTFVSALECSNGDGGFQPIVVGGAGRYALNSVLHALNAEPMEDRIPVLAFGSNVSPGALRAKYEKVGRRDAFVIPVTYAVLGGHDVVWSGGPGINGNFIAILYGGEETKETKVQTAITWLTREQTHVMHATEMAYDLRRGEVSVDGHQLPMYFYAGKDNIYLEDGGPVAVASVPAEGRNLAEATTKQLLERILGKEAVLQAIRQQYPSFPKGDIEPQGYVDFIRLLRKTPENQEPRRAFKEFVHRQLASLGMSRELAPSGDQPLASWHNPSMLLTYGRFIADRTICTQSPISLPSMDLPIDTWPNVAARRKVLKDGQTHLHRTLWRAAI